MNRRFLTIAAAACVAAVSLAPQAAHAGGYSVATAECATNGAVITWKHIEEARLQGLTGVTRTAEIVSVVVEATGQTLSTTSIGNFVWQTESFNVIGDSAFLVTFRDTTIPPQGETTVNISGPHRATFTCTAPPAPTTTTTLPPPTTAAIPTTTTAAAAPVVPVPVTTAAAPTNPPAPKPAALPTTGTENRLMMLAGAFMLLAGSTLTLSTQLRKRS